MNNQQNSSNTDQTLANQLRQLANSKKNNHVLFAVNEITERIFLNAHAVAANGGYLYCYSDTQFNDSEIIRKVIEHFENKGFTVSSSSLDHKATNITLEW